MKLELLEEEVYKAGDERVRLIKEKEALVAEFHKTIVITLSKRKD